MHVRETGEWHREVALMIGGAAPASTWAPPYECPSSTTGTVDRANQEDQYRQVSEKAISATLRLALKEFLASAPDAGDDPATDGRLILRETVRLKPEAIAELRQMLKSAAEYATAHADPVNGERISLTLLLTV